MNILNKIIEIEDTNGNAIMGFRIDNTGKIIGFVNCEIADIENNIIRIQREE